MGIGVTGHHTEIHRRVRNICSSILISSSKHPEDILQILQLFEVQLFAPEGLTLESHFGGLFS